MNRIIARAKPFITLKDTVMSTADMFIEKGKKIGLEKSKTDFVTNLLKNTDFDHAKIAALANVSQEFVRNIQLNISK